MTDLPQKKPAPKQLSREALLTLRKELRALPAKKRLDVIISRPDALKVVRALPALDLYATVREVGLDDSLEALELASPKQVQAFLDLDGWRGDRLDSHAIARWLRALFNANTDRAVGQLRGLDIELLTLLFKIHTRVYDLIAEENPDEDVGLHSITPDQRYLIAYGGVAEDEQMQQVLKEAVERMMGRDISFVLRLCEAIRWELPSSLEEVALRWRDGRMADLGFLPRHEALEVFAFLDPDGPLPDAPVGVRSRPDATADDDAVSTDLSTSVVLPWDALADAQRAFSQALRALPEHVQDRVHHELMLVANRVHCADGGDNGDAEALRETARQVVDTVGTALAYRAKGDPQQMPLVLGRVPLLPLFRVGHSLLVKLARDLRRFVDAKDSGLAGDGLLRLDTPLREVAAGLLRTRATLYAGLVDPRRADFRPPASLAELAAAAAAVKEIAFRGALVSPRVLGAPPPAEDPALVASHGALLGTAIAHVLLGEPISLAPLPARALASVRDAIGDANKRASAVDVIVAHAAEKAPLPGAPDGDDVRARTRSYASQVAAALHHELSDVKGDAIDARFVTMVHAQ
jgi:Family of unknown function (DUF6178)